MSPESRSRIRSGALSAAILSTIASSVAWIVEREAVLSLGTFAVAALSPLLGGLCILLFGKLRGELKPLTELLRHKREVLLLFTARYLLGSLLLTYSLAFTTASKAMFLTKMEPYAVALIAWVIYGQSLSARAVVLLIVHVIGAMLLSTGGVFTFSQEYIGDLLIGAGIICNAMSYQPAQHLARVAGASATAGYLSLVSGILLLPFALVFDSGAFAFSSGNLYGWGNLAATVVLFHAVSLLLWYHALRGLDAWLVSALRCLGPVIAAPIAWICYNQTLSATQILGALIVVLTSLLLLRERRS